MNVRRNSLAGLWHFLFLACLPIAVLLALGQAWVASAVVLLAGTPLFWTLRNKAVGGRPTTGTRSASARGGQGWSSWAGTSYSLGHPALAILGVRPNEVIYPGLGAIDWELYVRTLSQGGRNDRIKEAMRTLFLTNQRLLVLDENHAPPLRTSLEFSNIASASVERPPGNPRPGESLVLVGFVDERGDKRAVGWATRSADAETFIKMLNALRIGQPV